MKKWFTAILTVAFALCLCLGLAACGDMFGGGGNADGGSNTSGGMKEENDGTFIYSGSSVKAANTSISGEITIPAAHNGIPIDTIPADAFKGCNTITSIIVPESVTSIGGGAFNGCSLLRSITLPFVGSQKGNSGGNNKFGYVFGKKSYQGGTEVKDYSTYDKFYIPSTLRNVTITDETIIGSGAFYQCSMLTEISLNDGILQVGVSSFEGCSKLQEIDLPNISIIPTSLFDGCTLLSKFTINDFVDTIGDSAFARCNALSSINSETAGTFVIPNTVTSIGKGAFSGCILLKSITLPFVGSQRGNSSGNNKFGYIFGSNSYQGGTGVNDYSTYGKFYIPSMLRSVTITNETVIGSGAFYQCSMITSLTINMAAKENVGKDAFTGTATPDWV